MILPAGYALDFLRFCVRNPKPCPLLEVTDTGSPHPRALSADADLRTDLPRYRVFENGTLVDEPTDLTRYWRDDLVSFLLGCSFTFEWALAAAGLPLAHQLQGVNVPMYVTDRRCIGAGPFEGPLVVSMRPFAPDDIERLTTILRLQRDEFLPLRVIRQELDGPGAAGDRSRRRVVGVLGHEQEIDEAELCERASVPPELVRQLEEFGLVVSRSESGDRLYGENEADIAAACARLARFGIDARHLRTFLTGAGRQAALIEQLVAPGLRSRNAERRKGALDDLEALLRVAQELSHLLLTRELRATVERTS